MSSTPSMNDSLHWMTEVGVPPEDVQYLQTMAAYKGHNVKSIGTRISEIQDLAYELLLAASLLRTYPSVVAQ